MNLLDVYGLGTIRARHSGDRMSGLTKNASVRFPARDRTTLRMVDYFTPSTGGGQTRERLLAGLLPAGDRGGVGRVHQLELFRVSAPQACADRVLTIDSWPHRTLSRMMESNPARLRRG